MSSTWADAYYVKLLQHISRPITIDRLACHRNVIIFGSADQTATRRQPTMIFNSSHSSVNANDYHFLPWLFPFFIIIFFFSSYFGSLLFCSLPPQSLMKCVQWQNWRKKRRASRIQFFSFLPSATANANALYQIMKVNFVPNYGLMCDVWFVAVVSCGCRFASVYFNLWVLHIYGHVKSSERVVVNFCFFLFLFRWPSSLTFRL